MGRNLTEKAWYPSKWGAQDEIGSLSSITPEDVVKAARLVQKGKTYWLGRVLEYGIPVHWYHGGFLYSTFRRADHSVPFLNVKNQVGFNNCRIEFADHTGTHIDGLNHVSIGDRLYNGVKVDSILTTFGTTKFGMEKNPPIVTRGVLADVARLKGVDMLASDYAITSQDLEASLKLGDVSLEKGDALLVRTGWGKLWMTDNERFAKSTPGIGMQAAKWILDKGAILVGADQWNVEVEPSEDPKESGVVHQFLITQNGLRLIENLELEGLSSDRICKFLFVCLPLRVKGGFGSPVSPVAVV